MTDVFVSYSRDDRERIQPLISALEEQGWLVWWDSQIRTGASFDLEIEAALDSARCVIVVWSQASIDSRWVRSEAHEGLDRNILVPVLLDDVRPPMPFRQIQALDLIDESIGSPELQADLTDAVRRAFAAESEGEAESARHARSAPRRKRPGRISMLAVALVAALAAIVLIQVLDLGVTGDPESEVVQLPFEPPANTIAVLPFENLSENAENDYFSEGVAEEILHDLGALDGLTVVASTSSFAFKDQNLDINTIGRRLNVAQLLDGSVRRQGDRVRVSVQLVSTVDGQQMWSNRYDRELRDIFAVQDEIAESVVASLQTALGDAGSELPQRSTSPDFDAYDRYLLGRHYAAQRTVESIERAVDLYLEAIEADPDFVLAYTGLADTWNLGTAYGNVSSQIAANEMRSPVQAALELDESLAEVQTSYGALLGLEGRLEEEEAAYRRAIQGNSNYALAYIWLGVNLLSRDRLEEGAQVFREAVKLDPVNPAVLLNLARVEMYLGRYDQGRAHIRKAIQNHPESAVTFEQKSLWDRNFGRLADARRAAERAAELDPEGAQVLATVATAQLVLGDFEKTDFWVDRAETTAMENWHVVWMMADNLFQRGQHAEFLEFMEERLAAERANAVEAGPDLKAVLGWTGLANLVNGNAERAAELLDLAYAPEIEHRFDMHRELMFMGYRVLAHRLAGNERDASRLLAEALEHAHGALGRGWQLPEVLVRTAGLQALAGNPDGAMATLEQAIDAGFRFHQVMEQDPVLLLLSGQPRYDEMIDFVRSDVERMRRVTGSRPAL